MLRNMITIKYDLEYKYYNIVKNNFKIAIKSHQHKKTIDQGNIYCTFKLIG